MIRFCKNCNEAVYETESGVMVHRGAARIRQHQCVDGFNDRLADLGVEVWETECPSLVIMGTVDRELAEKLATRFYCEAIDPDAVPEDLHDAVQGASLWYVNRDHPNYDDEIWPEGVSSSIERPGDVPALIWGW